jgi:hypothetical protein
MGTRQTILSGESLYIGFIAHSGFSSLALARLYRKKIVSDNSDSPFYNKDGLAIPTRLYIILVGSAFFLVTPNSDSTTIPIASFRFVRESRLILEQT